MAEKETAPQPVDPTYAMYKPTVVGRDGSIRHPHGLYWLLRYGSMGKVDHLEVESIPNTTECILKAVMVDTFKDLSYSIRFTHEKVCLMWLEYKSRKQFHGMSLIHNGKETKVTKRK